MEAVNEAVRKIKSLVIPHPDEKTNGIVLEIKLDKTDQRSAKWSLDPSLALFEVTGSCTLGRQNIEGLNQSLMSSVTTSNIFDPKLVDQGLGIGSNFPLFNRHQLTLTRFIQLKQVEEGSGNPQPPVLVLHGHYGGCIGDLPNYAAFSLGGPNSVRGYSMGELGAAKHILELGAEIRIPVKNTHVYAFAEHGNDLGSSKDVKGNPTAVYRKTGHGSSYGLGVKLGKVRAEYTVRHNRGTGALFLRFGERY